VLRWSPGLANSVREGKTAMITTLIQTGKSAGMVALDQSLADLVVEDVVTFEEAIERAHERDGFKALVEKRRGSTVVAAPAAPTAR
jgi:twitching motility protein PilT